VDSKLLYTSFTKREIFVSFLEKFKSKKGGEKEEQACGDYLIGE
jgi:hypothetical protein